MAGDWIKIQHSLPTKPEVFGLARRVGQNRQPTPERVGQLRAEVVGYLVIFWSWIDQVTVTGELLKLHSKDIDEVVGCPGFAQALRDEGWLTGRDGSLQIPKYERHNGTSAKARALESEAKRLRRLSDNSSDDPSENCPTKPATNVRPEKTRGDEKRDYSFKSDKKTNSNSSPQSNRSNHSPKEIAPGREEKAFDLSGVDWDHVITMAETVAKKIPPQSDEDRRQWLKYSILADQSFGEDWLVDATEAVLRSNGGSKKSKQAHFVAVLKSKAAVKGTDEDTFLALIRRIQIPNDIWHMDAVNT